MNPYHHALSSAATYRGEPEDYLPIHQWFDESKAFHPDFRHRALRHHAEGIYLAERIFGPTLTNSVDRIVPIRFLGEQHVKEDLGWIPTVQDWLQCLTPQPWMLRSAKTISDSSSGGNSSSRDTDLMQLATQVYATVLHVVESFEEESIGADLAYLLGAILQEGHCEWTPDRPLVRVLRQSFPPAHRIWQHIRCEQLQ